MVAGLLEHRMRAYSESGGCCGNGPLAFSFGFTNEERATSVTGGSTLRRTLAALLHDSHGFRGVPRNLANPGHYSNYGLTSQHDRELSDWMRQHLQLACWPEPGECKEQLEQIEKAVFRSLQPPLNLKDVDTRWKAQIQAARRLMVTEARRWTLEQ